ncbi:hypothetical protein [Sutterella sp.]|uniref:hypothetical protein n=1 Tax=Sutterella sp. TaxID=1981025 RepID=UPI0026E10BC2|nr:hypothetical protein [Sutterella sp.]MDO5532054.1 hypothetical protein [Sutterella sp.]
MNSILTKLLNSVGLHTEAELEEARKEGGGQSPAPLVVNGITVDNSPAGRIFRQCAEDLPELSYALQTQVKAQSIEKIRKLLLKGKITEEEFNDWKRRIITL